MKTKTKTKSKTKSKAKKQNVVAFREVPLKKYADLVLKYDFGDPQDELEDLPLPLRIGEVNVPGYGWHACVLNDKGEPTSFWSEDDGWIPTPGVKFERIK